MCACPDHVTRVPQNETCLMLKRNSGDEVTVLTKRTFGTLTISRSSLRSFQFLEASSQLLIDVTLYDHGPHITFQLLRKTVSCFRS